MGVRSVVSHRRPFIVPLCSVLLMLLAAARGASAASPVLWGIGDTFAGAANSPLMVDTDLRMVTHWYNGPADLNYIRGYVNSDAVNEWYANGFAIQLIIHLAGGQIDYALSPQFLTDLGELVRIFKGNGPNYGPLYVVMFTEFSVWPAELRNSPTAACQTQYAQAIPVVHGNYKKAYIGLGFTGNSWQLGQPISIETNWGPSIRASDFVGCQQMQDFRDVDLLINQVNASISQLGSYGLPVMISHFKMWQNPGTGTADDLAMAMSEFMDAVFDEDNFDFLRSKGLFAWGWMDDHYVNDEHPLSYPTFVDFINDHNQTSLYPINEAEYATIKSSSVATQIAMGAPASAGKLVVMNSTALNQSLVFSVPVTKTGTYRFFVRFKKQSSRGKVKLYVADWIQGSEQNLYSASDAYVTVDVGTKTFNATGLKDFKFVVSGVGAGGGYTMAVDSIQLIPE